MAYSREKTIRISEHVSSSICIKSRLNGRLTLSNTFLTETIQSNEHNVLRILSRVTDIYIKYCSKS